MRQFMRQRYVALLGRKGLREILWQNNDRFKNTERKWSDGALALGQDHRASDSESIGERLRTFVQVSLLDSLA